MKPSHIAALFVALVFVVTFTDYYFELGYMPNKVNEFYGYFANLFSGDGDETAPDGGAAPGGAEKATDGNTETSVGKNGIGGAASEAAIAAVGTFKTIGDTRFQCKGINILNKDTAVQDNNNALCAQHTVKKGTDQESHCLAQKGINKDGEEGKICSWLKEPI